MTAENVLKYFVSDSVKKKANKSKKFTIFTIVYSK